MDSEPDKIQIEYHNFGIDKIVVIDNGKGISLNNLKRLGNWGATSKYNESGFSYYGFRGESLYGIAQLSKKYFITSSLKDDIKHYKKDI